MNGASDPLSETSDDLHWPRVRDWLQAIDDTYTDLDRTLGDSVDTDEDAP